MTPLHFIIFFGKKTKKNAQIHVLSKENMRDFFFFIFSLNHAQFCVNGNTGFYSCVDIGFLLYTCNFCRRIYHCKIQVKFDIDNHLQNFGHYGIFFDLVFVVVVKYRVKILFCT